jgi:hypothetical protein
MRECWKWAPSRKKIGKEDVVFGLLVHESPGSARVRASISVSGSL